MVNWKLIRLVTIAFFLQIPYYTGRFVGWGSRFVSIYRRGLKLAAMVLAAYWIVPRAAAWLFAELRMIGPIEVPQRTLLSIGFAGFGVAAALYVLFRFLSLIIQLEAYSVGRVIGGHAPAGMSAPPPSLLGRSKSEGSFTPTSEEESAVREEIENLKMQNLIDDPTEAYVREKLNLGKK